MVFNKNFNIFLIVFIFNCLHSKEEFSEFCDCTKNFIKKCYVELGCVEFGCQFYNKTIRSQNCIPFERHTIGTLFILYNLHDSDENKLVYEDILPSNIIINCKNYRKGKDLKLLIHDFTSHGYTGWIKNLAMIFLKSNSTENVISVHWENGARPPLLQAASNARVVALEVNLLLNFLMDEYKLRPSQIHIIGHGLGAHIAGYISKSIGGIKHITGLDPTGPFFDGMPNIVRLDKKDADFVDVIHTDASPNSRRSQGIISPIGHIDFYFNNGEQQPACNDTEVEDDITSLTLGSLKQNEIYSACSHKRAYQYYLESLTSNTCDFIGFLCPSYKELKQGNCTRCMNSNGTALCYKLGTKEFLRRNNSLKLFLSTGSNKPFCRNPYVIKICLGTDIKKQIMGYFSMIVFGDKLEDVIELSFNDDEYARVLEHGHSYSFLAYGSSKRITSIQKIKLKWINTANILYVKYGSLANIVQLTVSSLTLPNSTKAMSSTNYLCPLHDDNLEYKSGIIYEFYNCGIKVRLSNSDEDED